MSPSNMASVFLVLFALPAVWSTVNIVRRESSEVSVTPHGAVIDKMDQIDEKTVDKDAAKVAADECHVQFFEGAEGDKECPASPAFNMTQSMCTFAAMQSGAGSTHDSFAVRHFADQEKRPFGCFSSTCPGDATKVCFYFNEIADASLITTPTGKPICPRSRYEEGGLNSDAADGGCATSETPAYKQYEIIQTEAACLTAAVCLGEAAADDERIGIHNESTVFDHPMGCFKAADSKVYWNNPLDTMQSSRVAGAIVDGTPICHVKTMYTSTA